jgi:hypothetical protein
MRLLSFAILLLLGVAAIIGVVLAILPKQTPVPLVQKDDWSIEGQFFSLPKNAASAIDVRTEIMRDSEFTLRRS